MKIRIDHKGTYERLTDFSLIMTPHERLAFESIKQIKEGEVWKGENERRVNYDYGFQTRPAQLFHPFNRIWINFDRLNDNYSAHAILPLTSYYFGADFGRLLKKIYGSSWMPTVPRSPYGYLQQEGIPTFVVSSEHSGFDSYVISIGGAGVKRRKIGDLDNFLSDMINFGGFLNKFVDDRIKQFAKLSKTKIYIPPEDFMVNLDY